MSAKRRNGLRIALLALGIVFVLFGVARGEAGAVFKKASMVCLECIGIG